MPGETAVREEQMAPIVPSKSLRRHFYGMLWEPVGAESPQPRGATLLGVELLLLWGCAHPSARQPALILAYNLQETLWEPQLRVGKPWPQHRILPTSPRRGCPHPPSTHAETVAA